MKDTSLRTKFNEAAKLYGEVRPSYPQQTIEDILSLSAIPQNGRILEVGVGTGQITLPLAKRGYEILGLELGPALAERARQNLQPYPKVKIETAQFEDWQSMDGFDLLVSAQAFHWIEADVGLAQAARFLDGSGAIALVWNLDESEKTAFYQESDPVYKKHIPEQPKRPKPEEGYRRYLKALSEHPKFTEIIERSVQWEKTFSKEDFLKLLDTFSNHRVLSEEVRAEFKQELAAVIDRHGGTVKTHYRTVLLFARRCA